MSCWLLHKWGKWEQTDLSCYRINRFNNREDFVIRVQERYCERCNKKEVERLYNE